MGLVAAKAGNGLALVAERPVTVTVPVESWLIAAARAPVNVESVTVMLRTLLLAGALMNDWTGAVPPKLKSVVENTHDCTAKWPMFWVTALPRVDPSVSPERVKVGVKAPLEGICRVKIPGLML